ncbi:MAG: hypothetical protein ACFFFH_17160 [Candidatus Thorarchaeota archaeon]
MVTELENEKDDTDIQRTQFQIILIGSGLSCLIIGVILLFSTLFIKTNSLNFFYITLISGILFGLALFFEGHGYFLLPKKYQGHPAYFGSPILYQILRVIYRIPYVLLCYNGLVYVGEINLELFIILIIFYFPFVISRVSWRWTRLRLWLKSLDTV